jgi:metal-sulfur cluster biosynthetic enzyme
MVVTRVAIDEVLSGVFDPCSVSAGVPLSILAMGLVKSVTVGEDGNVVVTLRLTSPGCVEGAMKFTHEIEQGLGTLPGVRGVEVCFDEALDWSERDITNEGRHLLQIARRSRIQRSAPSGPTQI